MANDHAFDACYQFNDDHFFRKTKMKEEQISESKINYSDIVCYKISKNYIYLVLFNKSYYPVDRDNSLEEFFDFEEYCKKIVLQFVNANLYILQIIYGHTPFSLLMMAK